MTRPSSEREAIGRGPKGGASGVDTPVRVEVEGLLRKDHGLEGLLLGMPPSVSVPKASLPGELVETSVDEGLGRSGLRLGSEGPTREAKRRP